MMRFSYREKGCFSDTLHWHDPDTGEWYEERADEFYGRMDLKQTTPTSVPIETKTFRLADLGRL